MDTSNRIQTYAVAGLVVLGIALLPILYRAMRSGSQASLDALVLASALLTAVGVIVLATQLGSVLRQFAKQPEREALHLSQVTAHDGGPLKDPGGPDYVDDLPFVGAAHADRPTARHAHASEPPSAVGHLECGRPPPRPDDAFDGFTGTIDEFLDAAKPYPSDDHECDPGPYECQECCDLAVLQMGAPIASPGYEQRVLARMGGRA
ncbi:hypothetical protein [Lysobacter capsici]|uniref:hypothetical protein n=1 Tax=Lysobacter capsici TaxID=435897 RepID=UPI001C00147B|nr:hypothetical protein [Lysobacter capsici]QWF18586.1 hypothetical protein KME82_07520 [Lysobacter capsici]